MGIAVSFVMKHRNHWKMHNPNLEYWQEWRYIYFEHNFFIIISFVLNIPTENKCQWLETFLGLFPDIP